MGKHRDLKLVKTERRRNNLVSEPNYHTIKFFSESLFTLDFFYKQLGFCLEKILFRKILKNTIQIKNEKF